METDRKTESKTAKPKDRTWGIGIAVFYSLFVVVTLGLVFYATLQKFDLVAENYYEDGVRYQDRIDQKRLAESAEYKLEIKYDRANRAVNLQFPENLATDSISGKVVLFRPSNASLDRHWELQVDTDGSQRLDLKGASKGVWKVMVYWKAGSTDLYSEKSIYVE